MKLDRRVITNFDWISLLLVTMLSVIGIFTIYSATRSPVTGEMPTFYLRQASWLTFSLLILMIFVAFDYIWLARIAYPLYGLGMVLLVLVFLIGRTGMGAQRWLNLGVFSFQPSEVFKLIFIITLSRYLTNIPGTVGLKDFFKAFFALAAVPVLLIMKQPDLGTAVILGLIFLLVILIRGLERKVIILLVVVGLISIPFLGDVLWSGLKDYQKSRLVVFLEPDVDPSGIGYHITQSKVAVGSGQFLGKGYMQGTQGPFRFLPEKHTDFIFAVYAEERGFLGSALLLLLYLAFILRGIDTARKAKDEFGMLLATGISCMFAIYFCVNVGMTLGIMPVVGVPLPFMSYGGTALLTNFIAAAMLVNVRTRRFELFY
jgi:rod shape determining protein RodA